MAVTFVPEEGQRVPNIQELKDLQTTENRVVEVEGYNQDGDGGGGKFVWKANRSPAISDGGIYITSNRDDSGVWQRVVESERKVNVKWYGAVGDGNADDTSAFTSVWNHINNKTSGVIIIPNGDYINKNELNLSGVTGVIIEGYGFRGSNIIAQHQGNALQFENSTGIELRNISAEGESGSQGIASNFRFNSCNKAILSGCFGENSGANFNFTDCQEVKLNNCETGSIVSRTPAPPIPQGKGVISDNSSIVVQNLSPQNIPAADISEARNGGEIIRADRKFIVDTQGPTGGEDGDIFFVIEQQN